MIRTAALQVLWGRHPTLRFFFPGMVILCRIPASPAIRRRRSRVRVWWLCCCASFSAQRCEPDRRAGPGEFCVAKREGVLRHGGCLTEPLPADLCSCIRTAQEWRVRACTQAGSSGSEGCTRRHMEQVPREEQDERMGPLAESGGWGKRRSGAGRRTRPDAARWGRPAELACPCATMRCSLAGAGCLSLHFRLVVAPQ